MAALGLVDLPGPGRAAAPEARLNPQQDRAEPPGQLWKRDMGGEPGGSELQVPAEYWGSTSWSVAAFSRVL